ncbi:unnamed protein product [Closterium sp. NIES-54]
MPQENYWMAVANSKSRYAGALLSQVAAGTISNASSRPHTTPPFRRPKTTRVDGSKASAAHLSDTDTMHPVGPTPPLRFSPPLHPLTSLPSLSFSASPTSPLLLPHPPLPLPTSPPPHPPPSFPPPH